MPAVVVGRAECVICLDPERAREAISSPGIERLLVAPQPCLRYGSNEEESGAADRGSACRCFQQGAPEQRWLAAEEAALQFPTRQ